ncbi:HD domain-containing protein [Tumidithrix elongata RA019]|uniref:HD domain-containing protein n=1 Tax=Tumidithrix elongata BACA0141 TaxID=2716417 RepID=A0AAW9PQR3_9CYAN|nr:HD domain-containing protein [Tumidithrix elongata RA019]
MSREALFHEISIPDSVLAQRATRLVQEASPQFLYHHCLRTFVFADLIGQQQEMKYDRELLYLSAIMHDLGLTERFDGQQRYEVDGADAAKSFLIENHISDEKAELVWDAIALHTSVGIASRKQPEVALVQVGASMDVGGFRLQDLPRETVEKVLATYPRLNCGQALLDLILTQIKRKPQAIAFTWMSEIGRCHVHDFACPTIADLIQNNPLDRG